MLLKEIYRGRIYRNPRARYGQAHYASVPLVLQHPDFTGNEDDLFAEPMIEVEFTMSEDDPSVGYRGGADEINGLTAEEDFDFMGKQYKRGQEIPEELLQYWSPSRGYEPGQVEKYLLDTAEENAGEDARNGDDDGDYEYDRRKEEGYYDDR